MDFNNDGKPDVIVFSTMPKGNNSAGYSEVQFLKNNGGGNFTDVTDNILVNYNTNKTTTYNPQLIDVNNDGLVDILISATDYTGQASTSVLLQTKEGKFVGSYNNILTDFANQVQTMQGVTADSANGGTVTFVKGPNGNLYLLEVLDVNNYSSNTAQKAIYLSLVGITNTLNAQATVNAIKQTWPYLSPAQVNQVLAATGTQYFGATIINNETIFSI